MAKKNRNRYCEECGDYIGFFEEETNDFFSSRSDWETGAGICPKCKAELCPSCAKWVYLPDGSKVCSLCAKPKIKKIT